MISLVLFFYVVGGDFITAETREFEWDDEDVDDDEEGDGGDEGPAECGFVSLDYLRKMLVGKNRDVFIQRRTLCLMNTVHLCNCAHRLSHPLDDLCDVRNDLKLQLFRHELTSAFSGPVTNCSRYANNVFCNTKLLIATPITAPKFRKTPIAAVTTA